MGPFVIYNEVLGDLFEVDDSYYLAHCISSDAKMGAGIAVQFNKRFKLGVLRDIAKTNGLPVGSCHLVGKSLSLVTKVKYWHKPTYESFTEAIISMRELCLEKQITKIAMPMIGAGLDKLSWVKNKRIIQDVFADTNIAILVYRKKGK